MAEDDLSAEIRESAAAPVEITIDGQRSVEHPLTEQIAADKHLKAIAAGSRKRFGIRAFKMIASGTVQ